MAFPPGLLEDIRARLPCSGVIGRRVRLLKRGREYVGLCPFHNERTPSFTVNDDKAFYHCFGCGAHGDVIGFAMRSDNLSFPEAVERLAAEAGLEVPRLSPADAATAERQKTLYEAVEAACAWFEQQLRAPGGRAGLAYLRGRGLDDHTIARFRLGYAPEGGALKAALGARGIDDALLFEAGLLARREDGEAFDFFRGRVVFPITDRRGRPIAFGGRVLGEGEPKYLNSRDTPLFDKGRTLYGFDKAREGVRQGGELVVAEGYTDVIALHAAGFAGAVAPLGTAITEAHIETLWRLAPEPILCLDGDAAGQRAARRAAERALPLLRPGHSLRFAVLPAGEDPDSLIRRDGPAALKEALAGARPLADIVWESEVAARPIDTPERRAALAQRLRERIQSIADRTVQEQYLRLLVYDRLWAALRPARGRPSPGRSPGLRAPGDVGTLATRQAQAALATMINHPELIAQEFEALAGLDIADSGLDRIRQEILGLAGSVPGLDSDAIVNHLKGLGLAAALTGVQRKSLYDLWPFAGPAASLEAARQGWKEVLAQAQRRRLEGEVGAAQRDLGVDMTDENLARLDGLKQQISEQDSEQVDDDSLLGWGRGSVGPER
ncbi:MAG: DNA primase [Pseudomonadota bacterium]